MPQTTRELYRSANGDSWILVRDVLSDTPHILHEPNRASGGRSSRIEIGDFLTRDANGPQHAELLRLIGLLAE
jgi:hypothetical protein